MGLALKLLVNLDLAPEERATLETTQKSQRIWINLEASVTGLVHRKRTALVGSENFTLTKEEAATVAEYLKHVQESAGRLLWQELGPDYLAATEDTLADAMQNKAPVTPLTNPAGSASWRPGQAAASTDGPLPGGNFPSPAAIAAIARIARGSQGPPPTGGPPLIMPPGMQDLPTFDRKCLCSALEIVIKGVEK